MEYIIIAVVFLAGVVFMYWQHNRLKKAEEELKRASNELKEKKRIREALSDRLSKREEERGNMRNYLKDLQPQIETLEAEALELKRAGLTKEEAWKKHKEIRYQLYGLYREVYRFARKLFL